MESVMVVEDKYRDLVFILSPPAVEAGGDLVLGNFQALTDHVLDEVIHNNVGGEFLDIVEKALLAADDTILIEDSEDSYLKKRARAGSLVIVANDLDAIHDNVAGEIIAIAEKVDPIPADVIIIEDTENSNAKARIPLGNITAQKIKNDIDINGYRQKVETPSSAAGLLTINLAAANDFATTLTENITTLTLSNPPASGWRGVATLYLTQGGIGSFLVTWPASVVWAGGTAPTLTAAVGQVDVIQLDTIDGGVTYRGFVGGLAFPS
jgi:hypothetical protein